MEQDQPLPFDAEGCVYRQHGIGTVRVAKIRFTYAEGWCAGCSRYGGPINVKDDFARPWSEPNLRVPARILERHGQTRLQFEPEAAMNVEPIVADDRNH